MWRDRPVRRPQNRDTNNQAEAGAGMHAAIFLSRPSAKTNRSRERRRIPCIGWSLPMLSSAMIGRRTEPSRNDRLLFRTTET